jgi:hypothetical protein
VKGRVKNRHLRHPGQDLLYRIDAGQPGRVVQRRQLGQGVDRLLDLRCDAHSCGVPLTAMHDAVADGVHVARCLQGSYGTSPQGIQDAGDGIRMVPQRQLLVRLWLAGTADNQPSRRRRPVDTILRQQQLTFGLEEAEFQTAGTGVTDESFHHCLPQGRCPARARVIPTSATPQPSA